ncbi:hypothetical protein ACFXPT_10360 [Streptomyces goshikiensis]|uniref:hypothetical protein n=1 Tax=Streptomyces goshikiensis TaxID=1942 RepID=UPI0036A6CFBA
MARQQPQAYAWPSLLHRQEAPLRLVYLDLNHWISLAKAATGHRDGDRRKGALEAVRDVSSAGTALFPLSATHYMEMSGIQDPRQRADIADVMEELSGFTTLINRTILMRYEIEAALDEMLGSASTRLDPLPLCGRGVGPAFGVHGGLRIKSKDGRDVTDSARSSWLQGPEAFDAWLSEAERQFERGILRGPSDADVPVLNLRGWDPRVARVGAKKRVEQEIELSARLDAEPQWRRGRLRDVVSGRYVAIELLDLLNETITDRKLVTADIFASREAARRFADSMPSADVHITLTTAAHRNRDKQWEPNDIFDIDALSSAVPYCDAVVTERHACHVLQSTKMPAKTGTKIMARLQDLVSWLDSM